jgi:putative membrane protein
MKIKQKFSDHDFERIKAAVKSAEEKISGEVVPVIVDKSGNYSLANYKAGIVSATFAFVLMIILDRYIIDASHTLYYDPVFIFVVVTLMGLAGALLPNLHGPLKRWLITRQELDLVTRQRAETVFLEEEIFNTRQRTGIMIFISFFEHEVIVMADKGISKAVEQKEWDALVAGLIDKIREEKIVDGLEWAIGRCGEILLEKGFYKTEDDINELGDDLRING